jgi:hypothetical protein
MLVLYNIYIYIYIYIYLSHHGCSTTGAWRPHQAPSHRHSLLVPVLQPIFSMLWPLPLLQQVSHRFSCRWVRFDLLLFYIHRQLRTLTLLKKNLLRGCNTQGSLAPAPFRACRRHKSVREREPVARKPSEIRLCSCFFGGDSVCSFGAFGHKSCQVLLSGV